MKRLPCISTYSVQNCGIGAVISSPCSVSRKLRRNAKECVDIVASSTNFDDRVMVDYRGLDWTIIGIHRLVYREGTGEGLWVVREHGKSTEKESISLGIRLLSSLLHLEEC